MSGRWATTKHWLSKWFDPGLVERPPEAPPGVGSCRCLRRPRSMCARGSSNSVRRVCAQPRHGGHRGEARGVRSASELAFGDEPFHSKRSRLDDKEGSAGEERERAPVRGEGHRNFVEVDIPERARKLENACLAATEWGERQISSAASPKEKRRAVRRLDRGAASASRSDPNDDGSGGDRDEAGHRNEDNGPAEEPRFAGWLPLRVHRHQLLLAP